MSHAYYQYDKEQLLRAPKLPLICMPDNAQVFRAMAEEMVSEIEANEKAGKHTVFICPVGPVGQYPYFVEMVNGRNLSLKNTWFINMDEYLDDPPKAVKALKEIVKTDSGIMGFNAEMTLDEFKKGNI